ncbi:hypothetical protein LCGC14_0898140 [marine sediment metagenome]|uniref:Uncharacterized protein n=1 Tax=marine sediment metagenome TaxID=412755 RepID=A0A0F9NX82_9ZZZZ
MEVRERIALVIDFERRLGADVIRSTPGIPAPSELRHRARLVLDEALELCEALGVKVSLLGDDRDICKRPLKYETERPPDIVKVADSLNDIEYVVYGTVTSFGIQEATDELFQEVHRSNLAKLESGIVRDGKPVKPAGWQPPDLRGILQRRFPKRALLFR